MTPLIKPLRPLLRFVSSIAPAASAAVAFRLFCRTPSRRPRSGKAQAAEREGRQRLAIAEKMPFRLGNATVVAHRFRLQSAAGQARYLVVHGWGSNAAYISALCHALAEDGSEVVVLDLPGHGLSSGRSLHIRLAVDAIAEAERRFGPFDAAIGHSFGGASVMLAAGGVMRGAQRIHPSRLVVIGAPTEMRWLFDGFARTLGLGVAARDALIAKGEAVAGAALHDLDTVAIARRLGRPLLVVHAEDDKEVSADHARRYLDVPSARVFWANGLGHRRIVGSPLVAQAIKDFLRPAEKTLRLPHSA